MTFNSTSPIFDAAYQTYSLLDSLTVPYDPTNSLSAAINKITTNSGSHWDDIYDNATKWVPAKSFNETRSANIGSLKLDFSDCNKSEEKNDMFNLGSMFNGMFRPVSKGYCKLAMSGKVAVKTSSGYKTFDVKTRKLTNCSNFAFDMDNAFWVIPTFSVNVGDIVLVNGKPHAVIEVCENSIKAFNYEDSTVVEVIKEHHVFMGKTYCYGKIFSPFAGMMKSDSGMNDMMKMMMFSQMFNGNGNTSSMGGMNPMMMFMMMGKDNPFEKMFDGAFDFGKADEADKEEN